LFKNTEKYTVIRRVGRSQRTKKIKEGLLIYERSVLRTLGRKKYKEIIKAFSVVYRTLRDKGKFIFLATYKELLLPF
jgi:hypothetical protein